MHIAFLIRTLQAGGAERTAVSLAGCMARNGHTVTILCLLGRESFYPIPHGVRVEYLQDGEIRLQSGLRRVGGTLRRALLLRRSLQRLDCDVLVGMSPYMNLYAAFAACGCGVRTVGTERANPYILYASRGMSLLRKTAARLCTGFVCQTERARGFFPPSVQKKAAVIPNAVFDPRISSLETPPERDKTVAAVGRLDENKGFDLLLRAFAQVKRDYPDYTLTIYGEGESRPALEALAAELGIADAVHLPGADPDAILRVARAAVYVLSSRSEGMPNTLIEAMAAGVPCVAADCDMGPAELIEDGVNGLLVPAEDADAIARAVRRILGDSALATHLGENARRLRDSLHIQAVTERWLDYFVRLSGDRMKSKITK